MRLALTDTDAGRSNGLGNSCAQRLDANGRIVHIDRANAGHEYGRVAYGGDRSSAVEHSVVVRDVVGSNPIGRPSFPLLEFSIALLAHGVDCRIMRAVDAAWV